MMDRADRQIAELRIEAVEQRLAYQAEIARLTEALAEMRGERACNCETLAYAETEVISLRAALGKALEALKAINNARKECLQCDFDCRDDCEHTAFWRHQAKADELIPAVLSDPEGERANAQWVAMRECAEVLRRIDGTSTLCECGLVGDSCVAHTHLNAAHAALRCLKEVQENA